MTIRQVFFDGEPEEVKAKKRLYNPLQLGKSIKDIVYEYRGWNNLDEEKIGQFNGKPFLNQMPAPIRLSRAINAQKALGHMSRYG